MKPTFQKIHVDAGGGLGPVAEKVGVRYQAIQQWLKRGKVPAERVIAMEQATGISRHELRPDIYPVETPRRAA